MIGELIVMKAETCLNLCEIEEFECIYPVVSGVKEKIKFTRIYIGSYFCDELFLKIDYNNVRNLLDKISNTYKVTLVIPIFCQGNLKKGKEVVHYLIEYYHDIIDEITVNDYGSLSMIHQFYNADKQNNRLKINMGRLFFKDYREPRYEEYFERNWKPKSFSFILKSTIEKYNINEIEIDVTHKSINLSESPNCIIGLHTPYTYMTTGKICEFASMYRLVQKKFRPNADCSKECLKSVLEYDVDDNRKWFRVGRTIYFENNSIRISNFDENTKDTIKDNKQDLTESNIRLIYFPLNELVTHIKW